VRQRRIDGTAVVETRVRVPNGDVVQTVYSVADAGGLTVVELFNDSTLPVAIGFDRRDVLTERPIADVPVRGIELPPEAFVMPLGHRATVRIALAHTAGAGAGTLPASIPTATRTVRGWLALTERASRLVLPDGEPGATTAQRVTAARCELALGSVPHAGDDPAGLAVGLGELVRMGEPPGPWVAELAGAVERLARVDGWDAEVGLVAASRTLAAAGESRAVSDVERIIANRRPTLPPDREPEGVLVVPWLERFVCSPAGELFPTGFPEHWLGQSVEAYRLPSGRRSAVSVAVRWHAARPALLWEQHGDGRELTAPVVAPGWRSQEIKAETLWPAPA
jgi:hypothetical protein